MYEAARLRRQSVKTWRTSGADNLRGFATKSQTNPARRPDFGEPRVHPDAGRDRGRCAQSTDRLQRVSEHAGGGYREEGCKGGALFYRRLRFVKGAGFLVRGMAQVSMNLTDFEQTPVHRVFELVKREAARYGVVPVSSEIVGLIPKKALEEAAEWFLQVENFDSSLILENRLAAVMGGKMAVGGCVPGLSRSWSNWQRRRPLRAAEVRPRPRGQWRRASPHGGGYVAGQEGVRSVRE